MCNSVKCRGIQGRREGGAGGRGQIAPGPHPRAPTLEQEPEMFFKLVRAILKLRAPYSSSTCSLAKS